MSIAERTRPLAVEPQPAGEILAASNRRPWPTPRGPWVMRQVWSDLLFAHWPIPAATMAALLPPGLPLDMWEGEAWVGVVPFRMPAIRLRLTPTIPPLMRTGEINVRTYVTLDGKPGVYFFSLDADNPFAVEVARRWFHLPYLHARFDCAFAPDEVRYRVTRTDRRARPATFDATYRPIGPARTTEPGTLANWLTERYALYTTGSGGRVYRGDITHAPWLLAPAEAEIRANTLAASHGIALPHILPLLHYAPRVDMLAWPISKA